MSIDIINYFITMKKLFYRLCTRKIFIIPQLIVCFRGGEKQTKRGTSPLPSRHITFCNHHRSLPDVQVFPELERCFQRSPFAQVQHCPQFPLHGAAPQLRTGAQTRRVFPKSPTSDGAAQARTKKPGRQIGPQASQTLSQLSSNGRV